MPQPIRNAPGERWIPQQGPFVPVPSQEIRMSTENAHPSNASTPPTLDDNGKALLQHLVTKSLQVNAFAGKFGPAGPDETFKQQLRALVALEWGDDVAREAFDNNDSNLLGDDDDEKAAKKYDQAKGGEEIAQPGYSQMSTERRTNNELADLWGAGKLTSAEFVKLSTEPAAVRQNVIASRRQAPAVHTAGPDYLALHAADAQLRATGFGRFAKGSP